MNSNSIKARGPQLHLTETTIKELRNFGLIMAGGFGLLFGLFFPWVLARAYPKWPWPLAIFFLAFALLYPLGLKKIYAGWMRFAHVLGFVNTRILLGVIYLLVIVPIGFCIRRFGKDPMRRKWDSSATSYRITEPSPTKDSLESPY